MTTKLKTNLAAFCHALKNIFKNDKKNYSAYIRSENKTFFVA